MGRRAKAKTNLGNELADLPAELRWREWMARVEAVIFASREPVTREVLARVVGEGCHLDLIIDDIQAELRGRPYELVAVAGGWQHRTRKQFADAIHIATGAGEPGSVLSQSETLILMCIAYYQPIRGELGRLFGKEISRDVIGHLRRLGFIGSGPRAPQPGAPYTYVTTKTFLAQFGFDTLRDLPDMEALDPDIKSRTLSYPIAVSLIRAAENDIQPKIDTCIKSRTVSLDTDVMKAILRSPWQCRDCHFRSV